MPKTVGISGISDSNRDQVFALKDSLTAEYADVTFYEGNSGDLLWVDLLIAAGGSRSALAAHAARRHSSTPTRPTIVYTSVAPYVVQEFAGETNITGVMAHTSDSETDRIIWLRKMTSYVGDQMGVLRNSNRGDQVDQLRDLQRYAHDKGLTIRERDINQHGITIPKAFDWFKRIGADALIVAADPFFNNNRDDVIGLANAKKIPAIYQWCEFVQAGGLMSWGPNLTTLYEHAGKMAARILNNPATIPQPEEAQPGDFELCVNMTTADKLGLWPLPDEIAHANPQPKIYRTAVSTVRLFGQELSTKSVGLGIIFIAGLVLWRLLARVPKR
jgi:putative ABC transport system substrate-binding protein